MTVKRPLLIAGVALAAVITMGAKGCGTSSHVATQPPVTASSATTPTPVTATPTTAAPAATTPPTTAGLADKGWTVVKGSLLTQNDGLGDFGGTVRLSNNNDSAQSATFTLTLFRGSAQIATMQGSAQSVSPGQTVTVQLISQNPYTAGPYTYTFQTDISY